MEVRWFCKSDQLPPQSIMATQVHEAHDRELFATTLTSINPISSIAGRAQVSYWCVCLHFCVYTTIVAAKVSRNAFLCDSMLACR